MEIAPWEFAEKYRKLSDDELVSLWTDRAELTPEASEQLQLEMANRHLTESRAAEIAQEQAELARVVELQTTIYLGVSKLGIGFLGRRNRVAIEEGFEEFTSTRFICIMYFPLIPLGSYRLRHKLRGFWSLLFSTGYTQVQVIEKLRTDWLQVMRLWALALGILTAFVLAARISIAIQNR